MRGGRAGSRVLAGLALTLACTSPSPVRGGVFGDVEAGGGYDGNLNAAGSARDAEGDGFGYAAGGIGVESILDRLSVWAAGRWSGLAYDRYSDLSNNRLLIEAGVRHHVTDRFSWRVAPAIGGRLYEDGDRSGLDLRGILELRGTLGPRAWMDLGYTLGHLDARASEFDRTTHRVGLTLGSAPWSRTRIRLASAIEIGPVVRYLTVTTTGVDGNGGTGGGTGGGSGSGVDPGRGRPNDTFGSDLVADREGSTTIDTSLSIEQSITEHLFLAVFGSHAHVWSNPDDFDVWSASASLGYRLP